LKKAFSAYVLKLYKVKFWVNDRKTKGGIFGNAEILNKKPKNTHDNLK